MARTSEQAELLLALATLGRGSFRVDGGRLDRALMELRGELPDQLQCLSFSVGAVGLRCLELPAILDMAMFMMSADYGERGDHSQFRSRVPRDQAFEIAFQYGADLKMFEDIAIRLADINHQ